MTTHVPEPTVLTSDTAVRHCPICGMSGQPRLFADANVIDELNQYAFASRKLPEYMHWRLWECGQCDLLFANPAPSVNS